MKMDWIGLDGLPWNTTAEEYEIIIDIERILYERAIAIKYWIDSLK